MQLKIFPETPISTWEDPPSFPLQLKKSLVFPTLSQDRADSPVLTPEESRLSPHTTREGRSHLWKLERNPMIPAASGKDTKFPLNLR